MRLIPSQDIISSVLALRSGSVMDDKITVSSNLSNVWFGVIYSMYRNSIISRNRYSDNSG
jgi:hypothetical protein